MSGAAQYVYEPPCDAMRGVTIVSLVMPEQARVRILRRLRLAPRFKYSRSAATALSDNGRILDLKNFVSRMVIVPACRSTSPRFRRAISLSRSPAQ